MDHKHTLTELNNCSREELITMVLSMQGQLDMLNQNIEKLIEQVRLANSYRFGKHTETLKSIDGQLSFFDEAEAAYDASVPEPSADEIRIMFPKKNWMPSMAIATGVRFQVRSIRGFATSRHHGPLRFIRSKYMLGLTVTIRTNSSAEKGQRICSGTAL